MSKKACKDSKYNSPKDSKYICKKCKAMAKKTTSLCKPREINNI